MTKIGDTHARFLQEIGSSLPAEMLFDVITDTVFFIKDKSGRYIAANQTLVERSGCKDKRELIGRTASDAFPSVLGDRFAQQDRGVLEEGIAIRGELELHVYPGGKEGWCLTWKEPVVGRNGQIIGLCGISRDLRPVTSPDIGPGLAAVSLVLEHIRHNLGNALRLPDLARLAGLSVYQLNQRIRALFGLSAGQYVTRARIELACARLRTAAKPISQIALACGYGDQAAFTRQFRKSVGMTPRAYRERFVQKPDT